MNSRGLNKLTATRVKAMTAEGWFADGGGLYIRIRKSGSKSWYFKYRTPSGKRRDLSLGTYPLLDLATARTIARSCAESAARGEDPRHVLRPVETKTFGEALDALIEVRRDEWRSDKTEYKWRQFCARYAKTLMAQDVRFIDRQDVLDVLKPIWSRINHSARYMRGVIEKVIDYAVVMGWRDEGPNPARWKGSLDKLLSRKKPKVKHHKAIAVDLAPTLYARLAQSSRASARLAQFILLAVPRQGEARLSLFHEYDRLAATWFVPAERMKAERDHTHPLSRQAVEVAFRVPRNGGLMFPGQKPGQPFSDATVRKTIREMGFPDITPHGLRSTFRDWCGRERIDREIAEVALAHLFGDETERAYRREDYLEQRREVMQRWADYLETGLTASS